MGQNISIKQNVKKGIEVFNLQFHSLGVLVESSPKVQFNCKYMWELYHQVLIQNHKKVDFVKEFGADKLLTRFPRAGSESWDEALHGHVFKLQWKFLSQLLSHLLCKILGTQPKDTADSICKVLEPFVLVEAGTQYSARVLTQIRNVTIICRAHRLLFTAGNVEELSNALAEVEAPVLG